MAASCRSRRPRKIVAGATLTAATLLPHHGPLSCNPWRTHDDLPVLIACGIVGGLLFFFLHIPGGAMLGAVVAVLAVKMLGHVETDTPHLFQLGAQIAIGVMVGNMMTGGTLLEIRAMAPLMFGSTALLVVAGALGAWFICRSAGLDAGSAILATSPGGLQAVVGMASDLGTNAPAVLAFHLVRLYTVLLLAPFLGWLLHRLLPHS